MTTAGWLILWLPFAAFLLIVSFFRGRGTAAGLTATLAMAAAFALSVSLLPPVLAETHHGHVFQHALVWIPVGGVVIEFGILLNGLTLLMLLVVTGVGSLIFLYSLSYMKDDPDVWRFFASLALFAFSMLGIVLSNNLIQTFIFWELVGLSSYLLIGFWFEKESASTAGKKAFLTTRVGDVGMMIGILLIFGFFAAGGHGTFNFLEMQTHLGSLQAAPAWFTAAVLLLFMGVMGKSAQAPLHVWLPDAMEGPTPVSALIHAATMVAAGVFLLARLDFLFFASATASTVIAWIGVITAFLAATIAVVQNDIKKILAYSTLSQLGYMVMALGLHATEAGMFHLMTHAFFKALLFLGAGSLIHAFHTQTIWQMKTPGLLKKMPVTAGTFVIGTLALMGIPPLSGFFSKEAILAAASHGPAPLFVLSLAVVFLTSFYMGRLMTALFPGAKGQENSSAHVHEADWRIQIPLIVLGVLSVAGGWIPVGQFLGIHHHEAHELGLLFFLSIGLAAAGFIAAVLIYRATGPAGPSGGLKPLRVSAGLLERKYFFDDFYDWIIRYVQDGLARVLDWLERWIVVEGGVNQTGRFTRTCGDVLRKLQTGMVQFYALLFTAGAALMVYAIIFGGRS